MSTHIEEQHKSNSLSALYCRIIITYCTHIHESNTFVNIDQNVQADVDIPYPTLAAFIKRRFVQKLISMHIPHFGNVPRSRYPLTEERININTGDHSFMNSSA